MVNHTAPLRGGTVDEKCRGYLDELNSIFQNNETHSGFPPNLFLDIQW
jgi:hypothetical protein